MGYLNIIHGSNHKPDILLGKATNDYGRGFYCTEYKEIAKEWACKDNNDGFINEYKINIDGLKILNLLDGNYNVLNWLALLLKNRVFTVQDKIAADARDYIIANFSIDTSQYDIIIGYRADDSYFSFAQSFVSNSLSLKSLNKALYLGKLGTQVVLISEKAFKNIEYIQSEAVDKNIYYPKLLIRDTNARKSYQNDIKKNRSYKEDIFILDILREEMKNDDPRIQRIISN